MLDRTTVHSVIGKGFADKLDSVVFSVSQELTYTRREMVEELGCANFYAAYHLQKVLKRLKIFSVSDLWEIDPMSLARAKGVGETAIYVAMCILDANGYSVEDWWGWNDNKVKFSTFKHHATKKASRNKQEV